MAATAAVAAVAIALQLAIDPMSLNVDRWSAIHNWCSYLLDGKYPYAAQTHLGGYGSPFPVWQILHMPFYFLNDVGLSFAVALLLFIWSIKHFFNNETALKTLVLIIISPAWIYEVAVRSDLLTNFIILLTVIVALYRTGSSLKNRFWLIAVICGLFMSTRLATLLPMAVLYFKEWLKLPLWRKVVFPLVIAAVFTATFLPFVFWNKDMLLFFEYNPFVLQSRQGHPVDFVIFIPLGILLAMTWRTSFSRYCMATSLLIIAFVAITFIHASVDNGNFNWFSQRYDITYFSMALPFLMLSMALDRSINKPDVVDPHGKADSADVGRAATR